MSEDDQNDENEKEQSVRQISALITIPFVLAVPPIIAGLIGGWLDTHLGTDPWLMILFLLLGIAAAIRETYRIIQRFGNGK